MSVALGAKLQLVWEQMQRSISFGITRSIRCLWRIRSMACMRQKAQARNEKSPGQDVRDLLEHLQMLGSSAQFASWPFRSHNPIVFCEGAEKFLSLHLTEVPKLLRVYSLHLRVP